MGVSLERVQFKFASIIRELRSEPDVLSQFAVWVDLRLAEYKLIGNISLDCSGLVPDPVWLKGLNKGKDNVQESSVNQASTASNQSAIGSDNTVEASTSQSSPRKRSASKRASQTTPRSTPKQRRLSPANDSADYNSQMGEVGSEQESVNVELNAADADRLQVPNNRGENPGVGGATGDGGATGVDGTDPVRRSKRKRPPVDYKPTSITAKITRIGPLVEPPQHGKRTGT